MTINHDRRDRDRALRLLPRWVEAAERIAEAVEEIAAVRLERYTAALEALAAAHQPPEQK